MKRHLLLLALGSALLASGAPAAENCITAACHADIGALKHRHEPVASGACVSCHLQEVREHPVKSGKSFKLTAQGGALCATCHAAIGKKSTVHEPVKEGDCISCHKAHGARGRFLLDADEDLTGLCLGCHDGASFKRKYVHGPVAEGACLACHDPHDSTEKALLKGGARELCLGCHEEFAKGMRAAVLVHPPVREKPCTSCHDPHSSAFPYLLKEKMPDLCLKCHKEIGKKLGSAKVVHKPLLDLKGCGNCHSSHFSNAKGLLAGDQKNICLGCHGNDTLGTPPLRNIAKEVSGDKILHGPIKNGKCDGCHDPHASDFPRLLTGSYPDSFYAPYREGAYDLCLNCHDRNLLRFPETTIYTKFRNGERNLHFLHVTDRVKGRTCRACHETHGANGEKLIGKEGARFGQWQIKTRFQATATGGSCAPGCHWSFSYDRVNPVSYDRHPENATDPEKKESR